MTQTLRPLYEHAEALNQPLPATVVAQLQDEAAIVVALGVDQPADRPRVDLRRWYDDWPLPPRELAAMVAETRRLRADLDAAIARSYAARPTEPEVTAAGDEMDWTVAAEQAEADGGATS